MNPGKETVPLFPEVKADADRRLFAESSAASPELLLYMRFILADRAAAFDAQASLLRELASTDAGYAIIRNAVRAVDHREKQAAMASRGRNGISGAVAAMLKDFPGEFTGREVFYKLRDAGYTFTARKGRQAVYYALETLIEHGKVYVNSRGTRGRPSKYVRANSNQVPLFTAQPTLSTAGAS